MTRLNLSAATCLAAALLVGAANAQDEPVPPEGPEFDVPELQAPAEPAPDAPAMREGLPVPIAAYYEALQTIDRDLMNAVLSDDATILLEDLGVEQSKADFLMSLDEWESFAQNVRIEPREIEPVGEGLLTYEVCYDFGDNEQLTEESFAVDGDQIVHSIQVPLGNDCDGTQET